MGCSSLYLDCLPRPMLWAYKTVGRLMLLSNLPLTSSFVYQAELSSMQVELQLINYSLVGVLLQLEALEGDGAVVPGQQGPL